MAPAPGDPRWHQRLMCRYLPEPADEDVLFLDEHSLYHRFYHSFCKHLLAMQIEKVEPAPSALSSTLEATASAVPDDAPVEEHVDDAHASIVRLAQSNAATPYNTGVHNNILTATMSLVGSAPVVTATLAPTHSSSPSSASMLVQYHLTSYEVNGLPVEIAGSPAVVVTDLRNNVTYTGHVHKESGCNKVLASGLPVAMVLVVVVIAYLMKRFFCCKKTRHAAVQAVSQEPAAPQAQAVTAISTANTHTTLTNTLADQQRTILSQAQTIEQQFEKIADKDAFIKILEDRIAKIDSVAGTSNQRLTRMTLNQINEKHDKEIKEAVGAEKEKHNWLMGEQRKLWVQHRKAQKEAEAKTKKAVRAEEEKHNRLMTENRKLRLQNREAQKGAEAKVKDLQTEINEQREAHQKEVSDALKQIIDIRRKLADACTTPTQTDPSSNANEVLNRQLTFFQQAWNEHSAEPSALHQMVQALADLRTQCEALMSDLQKATTNKKIAQAECAQMRAERDTLKTANATLARISEEVQFDIGMKTKKIDGFEGDVEQRKDWQAKVVGRQMDEMIPKLKTVTVPPPRTSTLEKEKCALDKAKAIFEKDKTDFETAKASAQKDVEKAKADIETNLKKEKADLETAKTGLETENADLKTETADLKIENADLKTKNIDIEKSKADFEKKMTDLQQKKDLEQQQYQSHSEQASQMLQRLEKEKADLQQQNAQLQNANLNLGQAAQRVFQLEQTNRQLEENAQNSAASVSAALRNNLKLGQEVAQLKSTAPPSPPPNMKQVSIQELDRAEAAYKQALEEKDRLQSQLNDVQQKAREAESQSQLQSDQFREEQQAFQQFGQEVQSKRKEDATTISQLQEQVAQLQQTPAAGAQLQQDFEQHFQKEREQLQKVFEQNLLGVQDKLYKEEQKSAGLLIKLDALTQNANQAGEGHQDPTTNGSGSNNDGTGDDPTKDILDALGLDSDSDSSPGQINTIGNTNKLFNFKPTDPPPTWQGSDQDLASVMRNFQEQNVFTVAPATPATASTGASSNSFAVSGAGSRSTDPGAPGPVRMSWSRYEERAETPEEIPEHATPEQLAGRRMGKLRGPTKWKAKGESCPMPEPFPM